MNTIKYTIMILIGLMLLTMLFVVNQGQQGIILRLGSLVKDKHTHQVSILQPGLHCKIPLIETVRLFDTRLQTVVIKSSRMVTKEKKDVIVDYYVKWRINDLGHYFRATGGNELKAATLLEQQLNTSLRAEFGKRTISELVSSVRDDVMDSLRDKAEAQANELGVHVVDVRIKGIELPENTSAAVYQRMRADMQKIANRHRADGSAGSEAVRAAADAKVTVLLAKARSDGQMIRAKGESHAAEIYATAFMQNKEFFLFYRSLQAYKTSFNSKQDVLILDPTSAFFKYFRNDMPVVSVKSN